MLLWNKETFTPLNAFMLLNAASLRGPWHPPPALHTLWHLASHTTTRSRKERKPRDERRLQRSALSVASERKKLLGHLGKLVCTLLYFFPDLFLLLILKCPPSFAATIVAFLLHNPPPEVAIFFTDQVKNQSGYSLQIISVTQWLNGCCSRDATAAPVRDASCFISRGAGLTYLMGAVAKCSNVTYRCNFVLRDQEAAKSTRKPMIQVCTK